MKGCEITMFTNISFSTYGRCVKGSEWTIMNSLGTNRLYYIHSGNIAARVGGRDLMLEERNLYIFPQNLEFKLFPNDSVSVDHTFYDFWTIPVIKSDDIIQISSLSDYPLISLGSHTKTYEFYSDFFAANGVPFTPDIAAATADQILPMIQSDLGIGFGPVRFLQNSSGVSIIDLKEHIPDRHICLIQRRDHSLSIAAKELERLLLQRGRLQTKTE